MSSSEENQLVKKEKSDLEKSDNPACCHRCPKVLLFFIALYLLILVLFLFIAMFMRKQSGRPHVIFIIADDLGWNDVEWNDGDMRTPAMQALLADGVLINNSYAHPLDSPSRASILTGLYPFHMGLQHETMPPYSPSFLSTNFTLLPAHMKELGYRTHLIGKWHLGFCDWQYTPEARGFDSFAGFYTEDLDYYTHRDSKGYYDFRMGEMPDFQAEGTHSTYLLTDRATNLIFNHDVSVPLFLVIAFQAVHSPTQVPAIYLHTMCGHILDKTRRTICAITAMMDESIGNVTSVLREKKMLDNSVIVVTSDNGGVPAVGSSNKPFRGDHGGLYEGGTRVVTLLSGRSLLSQPGSTYSGLFHQVDWLPTILSIASGPPVKGLDGFNHWHSIRTGSASPRTEFFYNIDEYNNSAVRIDNFKLIQGPPDYTPSRHTGHNHTTQLYDLASDPSESNNLADSMPEKVKMFQEHVVNMRKSVVPSIPKKADPKSDPALWNGVWSPGWC